MAFLKLDCYQRPNDIHGLPSTSRLLGRPGNIQRLNSVIRGLLRPFPNTQSEMCTKYNTCHHQRLPSCRHSSFHSSKRAARLSLCRWELSQLGRGGEEKKGEKNLVVALMILPLLSSVSVRLRQANNCCTFPQGSFAKTIIANLLSRFERGRKPCFVARCTSTQNRPKFDSLLGSILEVLPIGFVIQ